MCIAAEKRNFEELHALRCQCSGTGRGPRKRDFDSPRTNMEAQEWGTELKKRRTRWAEGKRVKREYCSGVDTDGEGDARFVNAELMEDARDDRKTLVIYLRRTCNIRTYPAWEIPSEMALLIEEPLENIKDPNEASERVAINLSRLENDEEEENPQTNKCRALLIKMGWVP
eukprot:6034628-Pyramimonas_sp.AAC.1